MGENYFANLPNEILLKIFDKGCEGDKNVLLNLMLVCRHWKDLIEYYHVFETSAFFGNPRTLEDAEIASNSERRFKKFKINLYAFINNIFELINHLFDKNKETLKEVIIDSEEFWKLTSVNHRPLKIPLDYFHDVLRILQKTENLCVNFTHLYFEEKNETAQILEFPNLKSLKVTWREGEKKIGKYFINLVEAPLLSSLKIDLQYLYGITEINELFDFVLKHSKCMSDIFVSSSIYTFEWTKYFLNIVYFPEMGNKVLSFLDGRLTSLKEFKVLCLTSHTFIPKILQQAKNLEKFHTDGKISNFCSNKQYLSVKVLTTGRYMGQFGNEETFQKLSFNFPNIEVLRFSCGDLSEHNKMLIPSYFPNLKEINVVKINGTHYEKFSYLLRQDVIV